MDFLFKVLQHFLYIFEAFMYIFRPTFSWLIVWIWVMLPFPYNCFIQSIYFLPFSCHILGFQFIWYIIWFWMRFTEFILQYFLLRLNSWFFPTDQQGLSIAFRLFQYMSIRSFFVPLKFWLHLQQTFLMALFVWLRSWLISYFNWWDLWVHHWPFLCSLWVFSWDG